jgi:(S)-sulfolactate dehydrogenase
MIVVSEFMDQTAVDRLRAEFNVRYEPSLVEQTTQLHAAVASAQALIVRNRTQVDAVLLAHAPQLRVVGRLGVGLDNIDTAICAARGIEVVAATGANANSVAEYVVCMAMLLLRGAYTSSDAVVAGDWPRTKLYEGREARGKTLGLVGFGSIGQLSAKLAASLGMRIIAHDPLLDDESTAWRKTGAKSRTLDQLLAEADVVSLHVPLTAATRHLFDAERIASMKRGAVLINTSRGGVVDEGALAGALRSGHLAGAALDVFEHEPLPGGSVLEGCPNLILTPHVAGLTYESNIRVSALIAERIAERLRNEHVESGNLD